MTEWKEYKLGDLIKDGKANLQTGPFGTMLNASEYSLTGIPVIAVQDIAENKLMHNKFVYVDEVVADRLSRYRVKANDIIFGRKGAIERRAIIKKSETGWVQGSDCIRLRLDDSIDSQFISYQLGSFQHKEWMHQHSTGATMPSLNQEILKLLPLKIPPFHIQQLVSKLLGSLDRKIELLYHQNKTLEQLVECLFRHLFIENVTSKSEMRVFGEVVKFVKGRKPNETFETYAEGLFPQILIETFDSGKTYFAWPKEMMLSDKKDVLMVMDGGSSGRVEIGYVGIVGSTIGIFRHRDDFTYPLYIYYLLKLNENNIKENTTGSAIPHADKSLIMNLKLYYKDLNQLEEFERFAENIFNKKQLIRKQISTLNQLRDLILPKLMSGEIEVI